MHTLIVSTATKVSNWCKKLNEISYTRNITYHSAIKTRPYEAVYGIEPHMEVLHVQQSIELISNANSTQVDKPNHNLEQNTPNDLEVEENDLAQTLEEQQRKQMRMLKTKQVMMRKWCNKVKRKMTKNLVNLKLESVVSIKINKVDAMTPFNPNMLLGKITEIENHYA